MATVAVTDVDAIQASAEHAVLHDAIVGVVIGAVVCAALWVLLMLIAVAGTGWRLGPIVWMGAGVGVFAGAFYGGCIGTMVGARELERAEHAGLTHLD